MNTPLVPTTNSVSQYRLLVVDDNEMNRDMLSRRLLNLGFYVDEAENGQQALTSILVQSYDLVLLDIMMSVMDGYELLRQLKSNPSTALKSAKDGVVVVMNRDKPDAVIIGFEQLAGVADMAHVRQAMAVSMFKDRLLSLGNAAKMAGESLGEMLTRLTRLGIPVVDYDAATLAQEVASGATWVKAAPATAG